MLRAEEVVAAQRDMLLRLENELFRSYVGAVSAGSWTATTDLVKSLEDRKILFDGLGRSLARVTQTAYAYQVTADMTPLLMHAADSLDDTDEFDGMMAPTGCGFVRFEQPIEVFDSDGVAYQSGWLVWGPPRVDMDPQAGTTAWWFVELSTDEERRNWWDTVRPPELDNPGYSLDSRQFYERELPAAIGPWALLAMDVVAKGLRVGKARTLSDLRKQAELVVAGKSAGRNRIETNTARILMALWLMLQQTIVTTTEYEIPRSHRRWAKRMNLPTGVTVIDLRRATHANRAEGESQVAWSHRWVVRGHWRWQPYGPNREQKRRIWIAPHVKGPDDKPLVVTEKVYRLRR